MNRLILLAFFVAVATGCAMPTLEQRQAAAASMNQFSAQQAALAQAHTAAAARPIYTAPVTTNCYSSGTATAGVQTTCTSTN
jgi:hypothetical protein